MPQPTRHITTSPETSAPDAEAAAALPEADAVPAADDISGPMAGPDAATATDVAPVPDPVTPPPPGPPRLSRRALLGGLGAVAAAGGAAWLVREARGPVGVPADQYGPEVAVGWAGTSLALIRAAGYPPPVAARTIGTIGITLYESVVGGRPGRPSLAALLPGDLSALPRAQAGAEYHWPSVANAAVAHLLLRGMPTVPVRAVRRVVETRDRFPDDARAPRAIAQRSEAHGKAVGDAILQWSLRVDGAMADEVPPAPAPEAMTGRAGWEPTPPDFKRALLPHWGNQQSMVIAAPEDVAAPPPPAYSQEPGSPFHREGLEVARIGRTLTDHQRAVAQFWADGAGTVTPAGHWTAILGQLLADDGRTLDVAADAYLRLGLAVTDAFVACWYTKYRYNVLRPVTYVNRVLDPDWRPLVTTPPFPEYTSGHSVQSAAAAAVLTDVFGQVAFADRTYAARHGAREFASPAAAAGEAALSRLYGGIHYRSAIERGLDQGREIGARVVALDLSSGR